MKVKEMRKLAENIEKGKIRTLKSKDEFQFKCTACGKCCFNNDVMVNIYDLVRLRNAVRLPTQELMKRKLVNFYLGSSSGLPILAINFQKAGDKATRCPFLASAIHFKELEKRLKIKGKNKEQIEQLLKEHRKNPDKIHKYLEGIKIDRWLCAVHKQRPIICRLFPLGRIKRLDRDGKLEKETFILQKKTDWCPGWKEKHKYTLKSFLDECDFWHFKEGSDKSYSVLERLLSSGFFAATKDNKNAKIKPKFEESSPVLKFLGNLIYNFDSINYFSKDERVVKTISGDVSHEDFMYVVEKVGKIVDFFIKSYMTSKDEGNLQGLEQFMNKVNPKGGEK